MRPANRIGARHLMFEIMPPLMNDDVLVIFIRIDIFLTQNKYRPAVPVAVIGRAANTAV